MTKLQTKILKYVRKHPNDKALTVVNHLKKWYRYDPTTILEDMEYLDTSGLIEMSISTSISNSHVYLTPKGREAISEHNFSMKNLFAKYAFDILNLLIASIALIRTF